MDSKIASRCFLDLRAVRLANPKSITISAHTWYNDDMYQDDAHDGALCVSRVYPNLLLNVSYPVSAKCLRAFSTPQTF